MNRFNPTPSQTPQNAPGGSSRFNPQQPSAQPVPFDATPLGIAKNTVFGLPAAALQVATDIFQGITRAGAAIPLSLNAASNARSGTSAPTTLRPPSEDATPLERATYKFLFGDKPIQDLSSQVAELEQGIKASPFAQQYGLDKAALPLAFGGILGGEFLNLYPGSSQAKGLVKALARETDTLIIKDLLTKAKVPDEVAAAFAPRFVPLKTEKETTDALQALRATVGTALINKKLKGSIPPELAALARAADDKAGAAAASSFPAEEITPKVLTLAQEDWAATYAPKYQELFQKGAELNDKLQTATGADRDLLRTQLDGLIEQQDDIEREFVSKWRVEAGLPKDVPVDRGIDVRPLLDDATRSPRTIDDAGPARRYEDLETAKALGDFLTRSIEQPRGGFENFVKEYAKVFHYDGTKRGRLMNLYRSVVAARGKRTPEQVAHAAEDFTVRGQRMRAIREIAQGRYSTPASILQALTENDANSLRPIIGDVMRTVKDKVHFLDYLATPEFVLEKMGLAREARLLQVANDGYHKMLPKEIDRITAWMERVGGKSAADANVRIFKWLDGQPRVELEGEELKVAQEIRAYLREWADKLGLPESNRIANYITHIFDPDFIQKEFDPDLARLITDKIPGSVYDPFLEKRLGMMGYKEDTWAALDAYVKRATRKVNFDPALEQLKRAGEQLDLESEKYLKRLSARINLRPTELDTLIDNFIKNIPYVGYRMGVRPVARLSSSLRRVFYRGTLGLNLGSAMRNLTQGANTYAKLGERYTLAGYFKIFTRLLTRNIDELYQTGVLKDDFITDRKLGAYKSVLQRMDKGLFYFFDAAEKVNRGAAYFGAKAKAINGGLSDRDAIEYAKRIVRETQFAFGNVDSPAVLSSDLVKTFTQLQTYNVKQIEFLTRLAKNREFAGLFRYAVGSMVMIFTIGRLFGMKPEQLIPSVGLGGGPTGSLISSVMGLLSPDHETREEAERNFGRNISTLIPAGAQIRKSIQGAEVVAEGKDVTPSGRLRYEVPDDAATKVRAVIFGKSTLPEAQEYYSSLGKKRTTANRFNP